MMSASNELTPSMKKAAAALREGEVSFALGGSLAVWARGGPEVSHDIDFIVRRSDAERALALLADGGFRTEKPPENWLYKAYDGDCLIDLIFEAPIGETSVFIGNADPKVVMGVEMPVMQIDDVLIMKLGAMTELYMDYSSLLQIARSTREQITWEHVRSQTKGSPFAEAFFVLCESLGISS
jgi:hypothetical protein